MPLEKSTMTMNQNNQLERPNPFGIGELGFHNNISKPEINKTGPILLKEEIFFVKTIVPARHLTLFISRLNV